MTINMPSGAKNYHKGTKDRKSPNGQNVFLSFFLLLLQTG